MSDYPSLILLDLGGVLANLGEPAAQMGLDIGDREFWSCWLGSAVVRSFETGRIDEDEFLASFPRQIGLTDSPEEFRRRFARWRLELFPGVHEMIRELRQAASIALLSNTNSLHWEMIESQSPLRGLFDDVFLSYETGHCKPDDAAFEYVLSQLSRAPDEILFLDDSQPNVDAARRLGMAAMRVHGNDGLDSMLSEAGIDPASAL